MDSLKKSSLVVALLVIGSQLAAEQGRFEKTKETLSEYAKKYGKPALATVATACVSGFVCFQFLKGRDLSVAGGSVSKVIAEVAQKVITADKGCQAGVGHKVFEKAIVELYKWNVIDELCEKE